MKTTTIREIKAIKPKEALEALNRLTQLTWQEYPYSLLPNGKVLNGRYFSEDKIMKTACNV